MRAHRLRRIAAALILFGLIATAGSAPEPSLTDRLSAGAPGHGPATAAIQGRKW